MNWKMIWFAIWPLAVCGCSGSKTEVTPVSANHISDVTREREHIDDATDFDLAIREVNFDPLGDANGEAGENGIPDSVEMALVAHILSCPELDLSSQNGVCYRDVQAAWEQAYASARQDIQVHMQQWPHLPTLIAGYVMVGTPDSFKAVDRMTTSFGTPLRGDYSVALALGHHLGPEGDADGDGFTNRQEYHAFGRQDRTQYVNAALSATIIPDSPQADLPKPKKTRRTVGIVLYEGFELLDVFGPAEIWGNVSEMELMVIAEKTGPISSAQGVATVATHAFGDVSAVDILMIPGGRGTVHQLSNSSLLDFVRRLHRETELTTSVCTGSAILAKAGILDGRRATSNKAFFALAESQSDQVTWVRRARWVEDGKLFTSAGVSAGTDMALAVVARLFGQVRAEVLARQLEYHWHPDSQFDPFSEPIVETANQTD